MMGQPEVLVVDDSLESLDFLLRLLSERGFRVRPADSGELAWVSAQTSPPDLILLDIRMPGMDGFEVLQRLKTEPSTRDVPVILLSAHADREERVRGFELGAVDFVTKPFQECELLARVRTHVELARLRAGLEQQVAEQSAELAVANEQLKAEMLERQRAFQTLQDAELQFRQVADYTYDWEWMVDPEGRFTYSSPSCERITGRKPEEIPDLDAFEALLHPEDLSLWRAHLETSHRMGQHGQIEFRILHKDGSRRWISHACQPIYEADRYLGQRGSNRDITERKRMEEARRLTETQLDLTFELSPLGVVMVGLDGRFFRVNQAFCSILGREREELLHLTFRDITHPEDMAVSADRVREVLEGKIDAFHLEKRYLRQDGQIVLGNVYVSLVRDPQGKPLHLLAILEDITERKQIQATLRESEEKYRLLHESAGVGIGYYTPEGVVISYNRLAAKYMDCGPQDFVGRSILELFPPAEADEYLRRIRRAVESQKPQEYEDCVALPSGATWFHSTFVQIMDAAGKLQGIQIISWDITERKQAEERFFKAFQQNPVAMVIHRASDTRMLAVNQTWEKWTGWSSEEALSNDRNSLGLFPNPNQVMEMLDTLTRTGRLQNFPVTMQRRDGEHRQLLMSAEPIELEGKACLLSSAQDVTEKVKLEEVLRESEARYRNFVRNATEGIYRIDFIPPVAIDLPELELFRLLGENAIVGEVNDHLARMYGLLPTDMIGHRATDFAPTYAERPWMAIRAPHYQVQDLETQDLDPSGQTLFLLENFTAEVKNGHLLHIWGMQRDITESKKAKAALQESEARFRLLAENSTDMISRHAPDGAYLYVSPSCLRLTGYTPEELLGHSAYDFIDPEDFGIVRSSHTRIMHGDVFSTTNFRIRRKDGQPVWMETTSRSIRDPHTQEVVEIHAATRDITERKLAEEAVRRSEENYRFQFMNMNSYNSLYEVVTDSEGRPCDFRFIMVNTAYEEYVGKKASELIGKTLLEVFPETESYWIDAMAEVVMSGVPAHFENFSQVMDTFTEINLYIPAKGQLGMTTANITGRKRAEEALRRKAKDLSASQRIAHVGSWRLDLATNQVEWTEELYNMYGFDPSLPPPPYTEHMKLFTPESWDRLSTALALTRDTGTPYTLELETLRKDGSQGWMWVHGQAELDSSGKIVSLWGVAQDITERKQAERALLERESLLRSVTENTSDAIMRVNREGRIEWINQLMPGLTEAQVIGSHIRQWVPEEEGDRVCQALADVFTTQTLQQYESWGPGPDGTLRKYMVRVKPVVVDDQVEGAVFTATNQTELLEAQEEKQKLQQQLFQAQKMESIGTLAGGIAHDFNNLLAGISANASLLDMDLEEKPDLLEMVREINGLVKRGGNLTRQLLGFAQKGKYDVKPLRINDILNETSKIFGRTRKDLVIRLNLDSCDPIVSADRTQMEQVLLNLFVNAGHAMPQGGTLDLRTEFLALEDTPMEGFPLPNGTYVHLAVADNGTGMDEATRYRVFEPFFTTKGPGKGSGLVHRKYHSFG